MKKRIKTGCFLLFLSIVFFGCSAEVREKFKPIPNALGKVNELVVIADQDLWEGPVGDSLQYYLSSAYLILPQPEPIFDLRHFTPQDLYNEPLYKNFRSYLFVANLADEDSETTKLMMKDLGTEKVKRAKSDPQFNISIGKNKWANDQLFIYQFGFSADDLIQNLKKNYPAIIRKVNENDLPYIEANVYQGGTSLPLQNKLKEVYGISMKVPKSYKSIMYDSISHTMWLRKETDFYSSNILLHRRKYIDQKQLTREGVKSIRDTLGKFVSTEIPNTYMYINDFDLPLFTKSVKIDDQFALETRGIWEIKNDFMGGAFISYAILNPNDKNLLYVDGFLHAPGKEKRDYIQQLEHIIKTIEF